MEDFSPKGTAWLKEIARAQSGDATPAQLEHFFESVCRLTRISWELAECLMEELDMGNHLSEKTYGEYLWFQAELEKEERA